MVVSPGLTRRLPERTRPGSVELKRANGGCYLCIISECSEIIHFSGELLRKREGGHWDREPTVYSLVIWPIIAETLSCPAV